MTWPPTQQDGTVLAGIKAKPYGSPAASPDPDCGRRRLAAVGSRPFQDQNPTKLRLYPVLSARRK
jgi:hypothetical protein